MKNILNIGVFILFLQSSAWIQKSEYKNRVSEYFMLIISTLIGMNFMISSGHFLMFYIGLELATIPIAALAAFDRHKNNSAEAGIVLLGTEVKSLRQSKCSLQDAYAGFIVPDTEELYLVNMHISPYEQGNINNHEPKRKRKLLLNHREAVKLKTAVQDKGFTLIPLSVYFSGRFVKIELGLAHAKKKYDKREDLKKKDTEREIRKKFKF